MSTNLPNSSQLRQAITLYLARAYPGPPPKAVQHRLDQLQQYAGDPYAAAVFEHTTVGNAPRLSLRLGNAFYPHMKLSIDRAPDGSASLFRADTHDKHIAVSPGSPEEAVFRKLKEDNQRLAHQIEADWEQAGLPTFKTFLRDDLARRRADQVQSKEESAP